jgi:mono/diheme cytochrome c family protein
LATPVPTAVPKPEQLALGDETFAQNCASCHGGGFTPLALTGYRTAEKLYDYIRARMPPGNPSVISDARRYAVTAYLLSKAGLIKDDVTISADNAASVTFGDPPAPAGESQVVSGQKSFDAYCVSCHRAGIQASAIKRYRTALGLFQYLRTSMPPGNPDRVPEKSSYDIVAYMLSRAGLLKEGQLVSADTAQSISFE